MINFKSLWDNYPNEDKMKSFCTNKQKDSNKPFHDYCSIMMSECFIRSGIDISHYTGNKCWSHPGKKHILLAESLAKGIKARPPAGFGKLELIHPGSFQHDLKGRTGVIFFKDYWIRGKEKFENRSGDHIDLWNSSEITSSSMMFRSIIEFLGIVSDLNKCKQIWFWQVT